MEQNYRVIRSQECDTDEYLEHEFKPKYIDKFKDKNGKWRYVYMQKTGKSGGKAWDKVGYEYNGDDNKGSRYGIYEHNDAVKGRERYRYSKSNRLLSSKEKTSYTDSEGKKVKYTVYTKVN